MDDFVRYMAMYDSSLRGGEPTVLEIFNTKEEALDYVKDNPMYKSTLSFVPDSETYAVEVVTTYRKIYG